MSDIPDDIVVDVLSRLPVKSLLRFRCVCKSWLSTISDQQFIKKHLHRSTIDSNVSSHRIIATGFVEDEQFTYKSCSLYSILNNIYDNAIKLDRPMKESHRLGQIIGSCNCLLCMGFVRDIIYLSNPSIRQSMKLPHFSVKLNFRDCYLRYSVYGLGYDYSTDDYKVVAVCIVRRDSYFTDNEVNVYSLKTNSWRRIQEFPPVLPHIGAGKFVSGSLHWPSNRRHGEKSVDTAIIALDLATETHREVAQPVYVNQYRDMMLGVLGECLFVMANYERNADLWVMKEYGLKEYWTKLASISYVSVSPLSKSFDTPLFASKTSEILLMIESFSLYSLKDNTFKSAEVLHFLDDTFESTIYIESLVLLYPMRGSTSD